MPLMVHCDEIQPGMRLAEAFMFRGRMMLPGAKVLTREDVEVLQRKYPEVTLRIGDPLLDSVANFEDDSREREVAQTAQQMVTQSLSKVQERFGSNTALASVNYNALKATAASVIEYLSKNPVSAALLNRSTDNSDYLAEHSGNVFYLALVLGSAVRDYVVRERLRQTAANHLTAAITMDLLPLGLGAMFMDTGMYALTHLFQEGYQLTDEDRQLLRQHPGAGSDLLPDTLPAGVKMVVRTHHENFDGSGYPAGMPGSEQHVFTRIIRICDAYEAATAQRIYAHAKSSARVLWEMCAGPYRHCYDPLLAKVFRGLIQPFPIGAKLKLSDGSTGVIVRYNRQVPFEPQVIIAFDAAGERLAPERLTPPFFVGENNRLRLAEYDGEDLAYLYSSPLEAADAPPDRAVFNNLFDSCYP